MSEFGYEMAHPDFYLGLAESGQETPGWESTVRLPGWTGRCEGAWWVWNPPGVPNTVDQASWKIHLSAELRNVQRTLDVVATRCLAEQVAFKHLRTEMHYMLMHHKHGPRTQAGKVCAVYPRDIGQTRRLMEQFADDLAEATGPYVLTDRRFGQTGVVYYRYGARTGLNRLELDGTTTPMVIGPDGVAVPDLREPHFALPAGIADPFTDGSADEPSPGPFLLNDRYRILGVLRHSNAGGSYRALDTTTGATVMIKEARAHNGLSWNGEDAKTRLRREYKTLVQIHQSEPGLCPAPVERFAAWENEYVAMEFVPGIRLMSWYSKNGVLQRLDVSRDEAIAYQRRARAILDSARRDLDRLHAIGIAYGDLSLDNILIDTETPGEPTRLIDFETAGPVTATAMAVGTVGFMAPDNVADTLQDQDEYAFAALSAMLLLPLPQPLERDPAGRIALYRRDLEHAAPLPETWWQEAARFYRRLRRDVPAESLLPTPAELDTSPDDALARMADQVAAGLLGMAEALPGPAVFPQHPDGYARNAWCLAHGDAGVLQTLRRHGVTDDVLDPWWSRLAAAAVPAVDRLPPGIRVGSSGIAVALADWGDAETAGLLLKHARRHQLTFDALDYGFGAAGVGQAHLAVHHLDPGLGLLDHAVELGQCVVAGLDDWCATAPTPGLSNGFSGTGLFLHELWRATGQPGFFAQAERLARAELAQGTVDEAGVRRFHDTGGRRVIGYLGSGSAGVALLLSRLAADTGDPTWRAEADRVLAGTRMHTSVQAGLDHGVSSWAYAWWDHGRNLANLPVPDSSAAAAGGTARRIGTSLAKYLVRAPGDGLAPLGALATKLHADVGSGSAGVLLTLDALVGRPVTLYGLGLAPWRSRSSTDPLAASR